MHAVTWSKTAIRAAPRGAATTSRSTARCATSRAPGARACTSYDKFFQAPIGRAATAAEMGEPLILLNSDAARFVSGIALEVDYGYCGEVHVGVRQGLL